VQKNEKKCKDIKYIVQCFGEVSETKARIYNKPSMEVPGQTKTRERNMPD